MLGRSEGRPFQGVHGNAFFFQNMNIDGFLTLNYCEGKTLSQW